MQSLAKPLGLLALALTIIPPILNATQTLGDGPMKNLMLVGVVLWFATAPFWLKTEGS